MYTRKVSMMLKGFLLAFMLAPSFASTSTSNKIVVDSQEVCAVSKNFLSIAIDTKFIFQNDLRKLINSTVFINLLRGLQPAHLRIGGTAADIVLFDESMPEVEKNYDFHQLSCMDALGWSDEEANCSVQNWPVLRMTHDMWLTLNALTRDAGMELLFDLNVLIRQPSGQWDPTNALKLINFSQANNLTLNWQLGNEPNSFRHVFGKEVLPIQLGKDFLTLSRILKKFPLYHQSKLVGPDITAPRGPKKRQKSTLRYLDRFLSKAKNSLSAVSWHQYYINGRNATLEEFKDPSILDVFKREIQDVKGVVTKHADEHFPVWITETASAYGGGAPNLSNRFVSGFMWLDKLGLAALNNISVVVKQSFIGGNYGLIDAESLEPSANFWISYIYKKVVGQVVLNLKQSDKNSLIRLYAHCSCSSTPERNSVVVFGMNLSSTKYKATFSMSHNSSLEFEKYILSGVGGQLDSNGIQLNGEVLKLTRSHQLPALVPIRSTSDVLEFPPGAIAFHVVSGVQAPVCA